MLGSLKIRKSLLIFSLSAVIMIILFAVLVLGLTQIKDTYLDVDIQAYFKLDNSTGVVYDMKRNYDGTNNGATRGVAGKINNSFDFDGTNDYVNLSSNLYDLGCISTCTISLWVNLDTSDATVMDFFSDFDAVGVFHGISMRQSGGDDFISYVYPGNYRITLSNVFAGSGWYHIAWVLSAGNYIVYINGTNAGNLNSGNIGDSANTIRFGMRGDGAVPFDGGIDEVLISNRSYNSTEILDLYNSYDGLPWEVAPVDTCTCPGAGNNWEIDMSDYCNITTACDLTTGTLSFTGAGWCNCNASVDTTNLGDPGASGILYIQDSCLITID